MLSFSWVASFCRLGFAVVVATRLARPLFYMKNWVFRATKLDSIFQTFEKFLGVIHERNLLSLAVAASAAGVAGVSTAQMYINSEGTGEALVFPFYSAQNGNDTSIHIVNTTADFKAVKVRMLEGTESLETLSFNLYMSPQDHFSLPLPPMVRGQAYYQRYFLHRPSDNGSSVVYRSDVG